MMPTRTILRIAQRRAIIRHERPRRDPAQLRPPPAPRLRPIPASRRPPPSRAVPSNIRPVIHSTISPSRHSRKSIRASPNHCTMTRTAAIIISTSSTTAASASAIRPRHISCSAVRVPSARRHRPRRSIRRSDIARRWVHRRRSFNTTNRRP